MNERDIFLAALDIADPAEQAAYVSRTCAGNPTLLRQVETLLAAHERSGEFLAVPALRQIAGGTPAGATPGNVTGAEHQGVQAEMDLSFLELSTLPGSLAGLGISGVWRA